MGRVFLIAGALTGGLGVVLGAFGAHSLASVVTPERLETFKTGVQYQMYHALALLFVGWMRVSGADALFDWAGWFFLAGIVLFSGSLYLLVVTDTPWLGAITPLGGVAFIVGWVLVAWAFVQ